MVQGGGLTSSINFPNLWVIHAMQYWWSSPEAFLCVARSIFSHEDSASLYKALSNGSLGSSRSFLATWKGKPEGLEERMVRVGFRLTWKSDRRTFYSDAHGFLTYEEFPEDGEVNVLWSASTNGTGSFLRDISDEFFAEVEKDDQPKVHIFSRENGRYHVRELGTVSHKFIPGNYNGSVVEGYKYVVSELSKDEPRGRLVLLEGEPGTGKTRMVHSMIGDLMQSSTCILVPPSLMTDLSGPDFASTLIMQREEGKHIVLILEDADDCLIAREKNKAAKASLAALLNMSDGIMGSTLDLRVIVSTNQELTSIDRAILRPGRLLKRITVDALVPSIASSLYTRLTGKTRHYTKETILAQVYEDASISEDSSSDED